MTQTERRRFLLSSLLAEAPEYRQLAVPDDAAGQKQLLRALLNVRPPRDASPELLQVQDEYLRAGLAQKGVTVLESLTPAARCGEAALYLWQGDITTLQCDAIVLCARPPLHRQLHPYLCRGTAAQRLCPPDGAAGPRRAHRAGQTHPGLQPALPVCPAHGGAHRDRARHRTGPRSAGLLLPRLPDEGRRSRAGKHRILLHLHRRVLFPE